jgi:hypothetical protein
MRAALIGIAVASGLAGFLDGVAFNVAGAAAATAVPLATLAALRVLDHADDRTIVVPPLGEEVPAEVRPAAAGAAAADLAEPAALAGGEQPGNDTAVNTGQQEPDTPVSAPAAPVGDVLP